MILLKHLIICIPKSNVISLTKLFRHSTVVRLSLNQNTRNGFHTSSNLRINRKVLGNVIKPSREAFYQERDKVGKEFQLIYKAPMEYYVAVSKHFATFSLTVVSSLIAASFASNLSIFNWASEYNLSSLTLSSMEAVGFGIALFAFNFIIIFGAWKYPLRIYKNKNSYIAIFEGRLPLQSTQFPFIKGELSEATNNILPWNESIYKMRTKSVFLFENYFKTPSELHIMLKRK